MITLKHVHYEIHDEVRMNDKVHYSFIKVIFKRGMIFQENKHTRAGDLKNSRKYESGLSLILH